MINTALPFPHCAEVIASSLDQWKASCVRWDNPPPFGSLVTLTHDTYTFFGIVSYSITESADSVHTPVALGLSPQQLQQHYPHIDTFLHTIITCIVIGYEQNGIFHSQWAPFPPRIHGLVYHGTATQYEMAYANEYYLSCIQQASIPEGHQDELLLALLNQRIVHQTMTSFHLAQFVENYASLMGSNYRRLRRFLERIQHQQKIDRVASISCASKTI